MMMTFLLVISVIATILLCTIAGYVYNDYITRRKFSHIPGFTSIPFIGTLPLLLQIEEGRMEWFLSLFHKFKDGIFLLWLGARPIVFLFKPEYMKVILSSTVMLQKSDHFIYFKDWLGQGLISSTDKEWMRDRKLISPTLHVNILERFGVTMIEKTEIMIKNLENIIAENAGKAINIIPIIDNLSLDIVFETIMGINVHTREVRSSYIDCTQRLLRMVTKRINQPFFRMSFIYNLTQAGREYKKTLHELHSFTKAVIQKKKIARQEQNGISHNIHDQVAVQSKRKALLEFLLDLNETENVLTEGELRAQVDTFMFATYDTTSSTLAWVLFCLGNNLEHQEKVHEEIDEVFRDSQSPATVKQLAQLKYLDRVVKEALRLYPTVPIIARQVSEDNVYLGDYAIPKDTTVMMSIIMLHRNPAIWSDPLKFDPDRFLLENIRRMHPYAYIPFSAGPRNCIGQRYALLEEKIVLTAILRKWRVKCPETPAQLTLYDTNVLRPYRGVIRVHFSPK